MATLNHVKTDDVVMLFMVITRRVDSLVSSINVFSQTRSGSWETVNVAVDATPGQFDDVWEELGMEARGATGLAGDSRAASRDLQLMDEPFTVNFTALQGVCARLLTGQQDK